MKNKEIEEVLNKFRIIVSYDFLTQEVYVEEIKILLSYIEQLETDYEEAIESITWWTNRFSAVTRENQQLKQNRDKAIENNR